MGAGFSSLYREIHYIKDCYVSRFENMEFYSYVVKKKNINFLLVWLLQQRVSERCVTEIHK